MGWVTLPNAPAPIDQVSGSLTEGIQVLNDGRILCLWLNGPTTWSAVYSPDANGAYENGTWSTPVDIGYHHHGCPMVLVDDGTVACFGGHPGFTGEFVISVFNPTSNTWTSTGPHPVSHEGRGNLMVLDDGRIAALRYTVSGATGADSTTVAMYGTYGLITYNKNTRSVSVDPSVNPPNSPFDPAGTDSMIVESNLTQYPDGRFIGLPRIMPSNGGGSGPPYYSMEWIPTYSAEVQAAGSAAPTVGRLQRKDIIGTTIDGTFLWKHLNNVFSYIDIDGPGREMGFNMWMPKIGKMVMVGAQGGEILQFDRATARFTVAHETPVNINDADFYSPGSTPKPDFRLATSHSGQTAAQMVAGGSITCTYEYLTFAPPNRVLYIETSNGRYAAVKFTSSTHVDGAPITFGTTTITFTGLSLYYGESTSATPLNARVSQNPMVRRVDEGWGAILPSGNLIYCAGQGLSGAWPGGARFYIWDGTNQPAIAGGGEGRPTAWSRTDAFNFIVASWHCMGTITPTGQLIVQADGGRLALFTEDGATPNTTQRPLVDNIPTTIALNSKFTLVGRQLHGFHQGGQWGDDFCLFSNHPLVRLTAVDGKVYFLPTTEYSYRGIQPLRSSSCQVYVPQTVPRGTYTLHVISNGIPSDPQTVNVVASYPGEGIFINSYRGL